MVDVVVDPIGASGMTSAWIADRVMLFPVALALRSSVITLPVLRHMKSLINPEANRVVPVPTTPKL